MLLRKKLEPEVEGWVEGYTTKFEDGDGGAGGGSAKDAGVDLKQLWNWAGPTSFGIVSPMMEESFDDDYTIKERADGVEKVVTGLKRKLDGDDSDEEAEDGEADAKMEDVMPSAKKDEEQEKGVDTSLPAVPIDGVLRFMSTGVMPGNGRPNR